MDIKQVVRFVKLANKIQRGEYIMEDLKIQSLLSDEQKKQKQKVLDDIKNIQRSFDIIAPNEKQDYTPNLTKLDLKKVSDNQIKSDAQGNLAYYKAKNENDIETNYNQKKEDVQAKIDSSIRSGAEKVKSIENNSKEQKESTKNTLINRNIIRSSIYQNLLSDIEKQELQSLDKAKAEIDDKVQGLNVQLNKLDDEKQNALELFDIAYAVKLQDEIDTIKKKINDYNTSAIKYNNTIEQKEKDLQAKYDKAYEKYVEEVGERNRKILEFANKYGVGMTNARVQKQKYEIVQNYLNTLDKQSAYEVLTENDDIKNAIGDASYNALLEEVNSRKV